jgi:hypothetical protein
MRTLRKTVAPVLVALAAAAGCGGDSAQPPLPTPGPLTVTLATPATDDGAIMIALRGPSIGNVTAAGTSDHLFWRATAEGEVRVIVIGPLAAGPLVTFQVPDIGRVTDYTAELLEVASASDQLRGALAGYSLTIGAPPR